MLHLDDLTIVLPDTPPPPEVTAIISAGRDLAAELRAETGPERIGGLVTTDAEVAWRFLEAVRPLAPENARFCEWGSGLGIVTTLAAQGGWHATGLEIEPRLVGIARDFAETHGADAAFHIGSYKPDGWDDARRQDVATDTGLGFDLFDFDVIFGFPWPAEREAMTEFVGRYARPGTLFMRHLGGLWCTAYRVLPRR